MSGRPHLRALTPEPEEPLSYEEGLPEYQRLWEEIRALHIRQLNELAALTKQNITRGDRSYYRIKAEMNLIHRYAEGAGRMGALATELMEVIERIAEHEREQRP